MLDPVLRPLKEKFLERPARFTGRHLSPNAVTLTAFVIGLASAVSAGFGAYTLGLLLWLINRLADGLDGTISREYGLQSDFGGYLDILLDFTVYAAVAIAAAMSQGETSVYVVLAVLLASFYLNAASWMYLSGVLEKRGHGRNSDRYTSLEMPEGLVGGTETLVLYTLFFLFPGQLPLLFGLTAALTAVTIGQRLLWAFRQL
jgi:phosphatidylglycerophosphate synthase